MSGSKWRRGACVFIAVLIIGPLVDTLGKSLTDHTAVRLLIGAIGGVLGLFAGLAADKLLFHRR